MSDQAVLLTEEVKAAIARIEHAFDTIPFYAALIAPDVRILISTVSQVLSALATSTANAPVDDQRGVIECCAKVAEEDWTPAYGQHDSKMEAVAEAQRTGIATRIRALHPKTTVPIDGDMREALSEALTFACMALAFIGRDQGSDRIDQTLDGLCAEAIKVEKAARKALKAEGWRKRACA